jgi:hypothetical protein
MTGEYQLTGLKEAWKVPQFREKRLKPCLAPVMQAI